MHEFIRDKCELIAESISAIEDYFKTIDAPTDFKTDKNQVLLDAIIMRLQVIGENIKKINKMQPHFFETQVQFDTNAIIRFRDMISHHYEKINPAIVYDICTSDIPILKQAIDRLL